MGVRKHFIDTYVFIYFSFAVISICWSHKMFSGHRHFYTSLKISWALSSTPMTALAVKGILHVSRSTWLYAIRPRVGSVAFFPVWEGESFEHFLSGNIKAPSFCWFQWSGRALKDSFKKEYNRVFRSPAG